MHKGQNERAPAMAAGAAMVGKSAAMQEQAQASGVYLVECFDSDGNLKWKDTIENLVTTAGKNDALDKYLEGSAYTAAWYLGLVDSTGYTGEAVGDTMASHSGWTENTNYSEGARPTPAWGAASAGSKATTATSFSINAASQTIKGCFLASNATKGGTTGILYSVGLFSGGDKSVGSGDTLNVTYTASL
jgi:hypothetical protein